MAQFVNLKRAFYGLRAIKKLCPAGHRSGSERFAQRLPGARSGTVISCLLFTTIFTPISNKDMNFLAALIMFTIQPHVVDMEDVALMIDADLNNTWGESKNVRYSDHMDARSITVCAWDEGVTSASIKTTKNREDVKQDKIETYKVCAGSREQTFGMEDVVLSVMYISPKEDISFLTLQDGSIPYDVFEDAA